MAEEPPDYQSRTYEFLNAADLRLNLYRLVTYFFASTRLAELADDDDFTDDLFIQMMDEFEEPQIMHSLLSSAVWLRTKEEALPEEIRTRINGFTVGKLQPNTSSPTEIPLTFREACNKIIHAKMMKFDRPERRLNCRTQLNELFFLEGTMRNQKWRAQIDLKEFIRSAWPLAS